LGKDIIIDTNMLLIPIKEKFDIFSELRNYEPGVSILVLKDSVLELEKLEKEGLTEAKLAKENILKQGIRIVDVSGQGDIDGKILAYAKKHNAFIATNDKELKGQAKTAGISCLAYYKSRKRIVVC
jgi:rRNA-processing protein FCF1